MALTWAGRRRAMIITGAVLLGLTLIAGLAIAAFYEAPSCADGKMNQAENGIDCGGSCAYLCTADVSAPIVSFARTLPVAGRTDVIAYIENRNATAEAKDAPYTVDVYDQAGVLLASSKGTIDLPARSVVPLYVPALLEGTGFAPRAFVSFDDIKWRNARSRSVNVSVTEKMLAEGPAPRVQAMLTNASPETAYAQEVIATVFGLDGEAIGASRTIVREIGPREEASAVFTWSEAFPSPVARVEVIVIPMLP